MWFLLPWVGGYIAVGVVAIVCLVASEELSSTELELDENVFYAVAGLVWPLVVVIFVGWIVSYGFNKGIALVRAGVRRAFRKRVAYNALQRKGRTGQ